MSHYHFPLRHGRIYWSFAMKRMWPCTVHFLYNRKHLQMRSNLDLTAVRVTGETFTVRFESWSNLKAFDDVFGKYDHYRTSKPKPSLATICTKLSLDHHVYTVRSGLFQTLLPFKRRNIVATYGIDLTYNDVIFTLSVAVRYKKLCADSDICITCFTMNVIILVATIQITLF